MVPRLFRSAEARAADMKAKYRTPMWRLSSDVTRCTACQAPLDSFALPKAMREHDDPGRRHHCRWCGDIFCGDCTQARAVVRNGSVARVCTACAAELGRPAGMQLDPFVALAVGASRYTSSWPALLATIVSEPVLLSRACAGIVSILAIGQLLLVLLWSAVSIGLTGVLKVEPNASIVLLACYVVGDTVALGSAIAALFNSANQIFHAVVAAVAGVCLLSSLVRALRRLLLIIFALIEREEHDSEEDAALYREMAGSRR